MCESTELEAQVQAVKLYSQLREEIAALRTKGIGAIEAYRQTIGSSDNPLLLRFYAPSLYAHAMTVHVVPVQVPQVVDREETPPSQQPAEETAVQQDYQVPEFYQLTLPGSREISLSVEQFTTLLDSVSQEFLAA